MIHFADGAVFWSMHASAIHEYTLPGTVSPGTVAGALAASLRTAIGSVAIVPPRQDNFEELIQSIAKSADRASFARVYEFYAPRVRNYLVRLGMANNVAEELAQETMLTVWRKASYFDASRAGASTWILTIARNLRIDHHRRASGRDAAPDDPSQAQESPAPPDSSLIQAESEERVRQALASLSAEQAEIIKRLYFDEKPHSAIAQSLGLPLGTVKSRARLAIGHLRRLLDDLK